MIYRVLGDAGRIRVRDRHSHDASWEQTLEVFVEDGTVRAYDINDPSHPDRIAERLEREAQLTTDPESEDYADAVIGGRVPRA